VNGECKYLKGQKFYMHDGGLVILQGNYISLIEKSKKQDLLFFFALLSIFLMNQSLCRPQASNVRKL
jgi:hypothetical protein